MKENVKQDLVVKKKKKMKVKTKVEKSKSTENLTESDVS